MYRCNSCQCTTTLNITFPNFWNIVENLKIFKFILSFHQFFIEIRQCFCSSKSSLYELFSNQKTWYFMLKQYYLFIFLRTARHLSRLLKFIISKYRNRNIKVNKEKHLIRSKKVHIDTLESQIK